MFSHLILSWGPLRSRHQYRIKHERDLPGKIPVKENGEDVRIKSQDLTSKNTGDLVKFECQINSEQYFSVCIWPMQYEPCTLVLKN